MNKVMDLKSFTGDSFDVKNWINQAYAASNKSEDKEVFVRNTISGLQLHMQQLGHALEETTSQVLAGLPRLMREGVEADMGARALGARGSSLQAALRSAQRAAGQPLLALQRTDRLKTRLEEARQALKEADRWEALAASLEALLEGGGAPDVPASTRLVGDMTSCLQVLSGASDYEDKRLQLEGLKNRLEALLSPAVVEAFTGRHTEKCRQLWEAFGAMGRAGALAGYRARCEGAALRARVAPETVNSAAQLRDLHAALLRHAAQQLEWAPLACPEPALPALLRLAGPLLRAVPAPPTSSVSLEELQDRLAACDQYTAQMSSIVALAGGVTNEELAEFVRDVYHPVRGGLSRLGDVLVAAMSEDLGPMPVVDVNSVEAGTAMRLRVSRGVWALRNRLAQGRAISRGATPHHLHRAVQGLVEELSSGWEAQGLAGCLALLRAHSALAALRTEADHILERAPQEDARIPPPALGSLEWTEVLRPEGAPPPAPSPAAPCPSVELQKRLRSTALQLLLAPIAHHLEGVEDLPGWRDNEARVAELPDFSLSPQEYITQVGQYLLTLPQHLEPMLERGEMPASEEDPAYQFLNEVCNRASEMVSLKLAAVPLLDSLGLRKCATDVAYLSSVLEELGAGSEGLRLLAHTLARRQAS